ncbi:ABSCISIC ACID-INSENSITIVE 5-like protein 5 [Camellia lanceoleosa]|uniref:ABSCISIC ACID-INSENSITIVE 5-like protein 5 n=1 Tax=Camellia lanceoleosa TaxID=1840588 RepID=A0ACC0INK7_9ERIC|nr:ABSCISIC ACID-INSENSITIVE 5-like protein 5 [Camellia lanceoleosa]
MGSYLNFKYFGETPQPDGSGMKPVGNFPLARQSSIYSLTFDEFQNTLGGFGKDFGSMNMDELLKNIWTAEETQAMASSSGVGEGNALGGNLQRQGSLTLPRTLSTKTVDEVWRDFVKETTGGANDGGGSVNGGSNLQQQQQQQQRQPTLGEMTLEEFLARAGVVREDAQPITRPNNSGFYVDHLSQPNNNTTSLNGLTFGFQQSAENNVVVANRITENNNNNNSVPNQSSGLPLNVSGVRSSQQQLQQHQQPLLPKQVTVAFTSPMPVVNNAQLANHNPGTRGPVVRMVDPSTNNGLIQGSVLQTGGVVSMTGLGARTTATVAAGGSPASQLSSEGVAKSNNMDTASLSPPPLMFSGGVRGRKCGGTLEKAMERRHRRMIKNRESAARSRARKQAYTLELEAEVAKLKELNKELQKKQEEIMEMQKNQILETMDMPWGSKRRCLRRTMTGPW